MKFVDRIDEQRRLHDALHGDHPSALVVVYGRRRLGKSTLIKKVLRDDDVYFMPTTPSPFSSAGCWPRL